jgi:hypothetical protein
MAEKSAQSVGLLRWCGIALVPAGVLIAVATLLHPSRETATTIIASEAGLIAAHFLYTLAWLLVLLGLPGLYVSQRGSMGRLGLAGFLVAFSGTYLIAVGGNFGFLPRFWPRRRLQCLTRSPVLAGGGHQWAGCNRLHGRLRPVRCGHD